MPRAVEIENIEEMRLERGIDDVELRQEIRGLDVGDQVRITLLTDWPLRSAETLRVRITRICGSRFHGTLSSWPVSPGLSALRADSALVFHACHIHSVLKRQVSPGGERTSCRAARPSGG
jgi:hypothetical protein